jgi:hypothetical protein
VHADDVGARAAARHDVDGDGGRGCKEERVVDGQW